MLVFNYHVLANMKLIHYFLTCLILLLVLIISLWFLPIPEHAAGTVHPTYKTMLHSGDHVLASTTARTVSFLFGLGVILIMYFFIRYGAIRKRGTGKLKLWINIGFVIYIIVYTLNFLSYINYETTGHDEFFLGWPTPTAWMIYGMWTAPAILMFIYVLKFREWILDEEDEAKFYEILEKRKARQVE